VVCFGVQFAKTNSIAYAFTLCQNCTRFTPFGQGTVCQREDWKKHKMDCSLLPPGPLPPADTKPTDELDAEVRRVADLLKAVRESWKVILWSSMWTELIFILFLVRILNRWIIRITTVSLMKQRRYGGPRWKRRSASSSVVRP
jgi:hypothetical protein